MGPLKVTKNDYLDKYRYPGYGKEFDSCSKFLFRDGSYGKNIIIFEADMWSLVHNDSKGKDILILGECQIQGLDYTTGTKEAKYPIDFIQSEKRFVLNLHCNGSNSFLFVNATKVCQFKVKNSEIKDYSFCLGISQKNLQLIIRKKTNKNKQTNKQTKKNRIKRSYKAFLC